MSQHRRSARLRGEPAEYQGLDDHGVPVVDLTDVDDVQCSVCGLTDGIVHQFPCCGQEAHRECAIRCPSCDAIQSEGASHHETDLWSLVASMHSIWNVLSALSSHVESYGWDARTLSRPGEGTQSWLFCRLISLGMLLNILAYTTGPRAPVPKCQRQFWSRNAGELIDAYAAHFASLPRNDPLVAALTQSQAWGPSGDHLDARLQEQCTPPHILSMMEVWISAQVAGSTIPPSAPTVVDTNFHNGSSGSPADNVGAPSRPLPSPFVPSRTFPEVPPRSPFASQASHVPLHGSVVSNPFATSLPTGNNTVASNRGPPLPGAGPVRLTRFPEMPRDQHDATVNAMITAGHFNHIGEASVRLEGQTAWGVWLRIDHWRASRGASRLRCGMLYHPINRELTFHGVASVGTQFL